LSQRDAHAGSADELSLNFNGSELCYERCSIEENIVRMKRVGYAMAKILRAGGINCWHFVNM